ncbi:hypothetical protein BFP70_15245 [Thioclava sp. SK-1]|uniref:translocation/assembly module TamB domain-containing protein n=1 Tax=Thioclava sp. SK-1 TaxID=1889770 RepID=UPI000825CCA3|nr:translocation/assembly module TamB domain-containing protein [Thioclava sp. SK-1]OCX61661.1 hypothetical protein BFP70_15245 [Thioclava sp. SK-1]
MKRVLATMFLAVWPAIGFAQDGATDAQAGAATAEQTQRDRSYLTGLIEDKLSGSGRQIRLDGFKGALSSRATFDSLTISDDQGAWLTITDGAMAWNRSAILRGEFEIDELSAASIELPRLPVSEAATVSAEAQPFALPDLPVSVVIGKLDVAKVSLGAPIIGQALQFSANGSVTLKDGDGNAKLNLTRTDDVKGTFALTASYGNASQELSVDLLADEGKGGLISSLVGLPGEPAVTLAVAGSGPLSNFSANISLATDGRPRISGQVVMRDAVAEGAPAGSDPERQFSANLAGDVTPMLPEAYRGFFGDSLTLKTDGAVKPNGAIELSDLTLDAQAIDLNGSLLLLPSGLPEKIDLNLKLGLSNSEMVLLPISGADTRLRTADLMLGYDKAQGDGWSLTGDVTEFERADVVMQGLRLNGSGRISQRDDQPPTVGGTVQFAASGLKMTDPALDAAVGPFVTGKTLFNWQQGAPIRLSNLNVKGQDYGLIAQLQFEQPESGIVLAGRASLRHDDLSSLAELAGMPLKGAVQADIAGNSTLLSGAFDADLTVIGQDLAIGQPQADAALKGRSQIALVASRDGNGLVIDTLTANSAALQAQASGVLASGASQLDLDATADLAVLGTGYSGEITAKASLNETTAGRAVIMNASGRDLAVGIADVDPLLRGQTVLVVDALEKDGAITLNDFTARNPQIDAQVSGLYAAGASDLVAKLQANLPTMSRFGGTVTADATYKETGSKRDITLDGQTQNLAIGQAQVDSLLRGVTKLSLQAREDNGMIEVQNFDLKNPQLSAQAQGAAQGSNRKVDLSARLNNMALLVPGFAGAATLSGSVIDDGAGYDVDISATGPGGVDADVSGRVARTLANANLAITGGAQAGLANMFIAPRTVDGPIRFDLNLNGPLGLQSLNGTISTSGARVSAPTLDLVLEGIDLTAQMNGGRMTLNGGGALGTGGRISVNGPITLSAPYQGDLTVTLDQARLRNPDLYDTKVTGAVRMNGPLTGGARISGNLTLSDTELRVPSTGLGGVESIPDMTHVNEGAASRTTRARAGLLDSAGNGGGSGGGGGVAYPLDITISAPNQIFVRGRGLDAELGGSLRITGTTANVIPIGSFSLMRGRLDVLSQRFTLDKGEISLQGEFVPYIEFAATTTKNDYAITISIYGNATTPELSFTSSPQLPDEEVLSQLLFSRGLDNISAIQAAQLASAVATLAGKGGNGIVANLRKSTGLDDLDVGTDDQGNATLQAGKYLSDNLYTNVEVGSDGTTEINLNLDITDHITARGTVGSSGDSGLGVFLEKDY